MNIDKLFEKAKAAGITDLEIFREKSKKLQVSLFDSEVESTTISSIDGLFVKGVYNNKVGNTYTEDLCDDEIDVLVSNVIENAKNIDNDKLPLLHNGKDHYSDNLLYSEKLSSTSIEDKIALIKEIDKEIRSYEFIDTINGASYIEFTTTTTIKNTLGLDKTDTKNIGYISFGAIAKKGEETATSGNFVTFSDIAEVDSTKFAQDIAADTVAQLHTTELKSGTYNVILSNGVSASMLEVVSGSFSQENADKGLSKFSGMIGKNVASSIVNILDHPNHSLGTNNCNFDSEGVATYKKYIIENGKLNMFLNNLEYAKEHDLQPTGNGFKAGYKGIPGIKHSNLYFRCSSDNSLEDLFSTLKDGLYITEVRGLHSGFNGLNGEFSLQSFGYLVENGMKTSAIKMFTISGNYFELIENIQRVGKDLKFSTSGVGSPSILVEGINVAAKQINIFQ